MTTDARHSKQSVSNGGVHGMVAYEYANETARLAATGFVGNDLYKIAVDLDTFELYILVDIDPITWVYFGTGPSSQFNKVAVNCRKSTAGTLAKGTVVYANGYDHTGSYATVEAAKANSPTTLPVVGIIETECTDSVTGTVLVVGVLHEVDTSAFSAQAPLYCSHTVAGEFTDTAPPGPYVVQSVGVVLNSDATEGHVGVNIGGFRGIDYASTPEDLGTAAAGTSNLASPSDHIHNSELVDQSAIIYVGKHGNDSNDGNNIENAFLTFGAALSEAQSRTPSQFNPFVIRCFDNGIYAESITCISYVNVEAPVAFFMGEISLADRSSFSAGTIIVGNGQTAIKKTTGTETSAFNVVGITGSGTANGVLNDGTDSIIIGKAAYIRVDDGNAIEDNSSGDGHTHIEINDIYLYGDGKGIVSAGGSGRVYAQVDEIDDLGSGTTTGIDAQTGDVRCNVKMLACDTAWDVASGASLEAFIGSYSGSVTEDGTVNVTIAGAGLEPTDTAPVNVTKAAAAAGSASDVSRQDHKHDVTTATASAQVPGDSAIEGSATSLARSDHKHSLPAYGTGSGTFCQGNDSRLSDARTPTAHTTTHQLGGSDPIKLDDLSTPDDNTDLNSSTSRHGLLRKLDGLTTTFLRGDGAWASAITGLSFQSAVSEGESSTTSATYLQKVRLTTPSLTAGTYYIGWSCELSSAADEKQNQVQVELDDTTQLAFNHSEVKCKYVDGEWRACGGFYVGALTAAVHTIDLDYRTLNDTIYIRRARLVIWRIA